MSRFIPGVAWVHGFTDHWAHLGADREMAADESRVSRFGRRCVDRLVPRDVRAYARINQAPGGPNYAVLCWEGKPVIHLLRKDEAPHGLYAPVEAQFWIDGDIDDLFAKVSALGVTVIEPPTNRAWGHRDFIVADPDSNLIWITRPLSKVA